MKKKLQIYLISNPASSCLAGPDQMVLQVIRAPGLHVPHLVLDEGNSRQ